MHRLHDFLANRYSILSKPWAWLALGVFLTLVVGGRAIAQSTPLRLAITTIDDGSFPGMVVSVAVFDGSGPIEGLTAADFQLTEDETAAVSTASIEAVDNQPLRIMLAIDRSMPPADLDQIKAAATSLIQTITPRDKAMVISFAEEVDQLTPAFTNNTTDLQSAINDISSGGGLTASHAALEQVVSRFIGAGQMEEGRPAVIVIADSRDNTGATSIDSTLQQAQAANLPLYVIGFGDKTQRDPLRERLAATGGQYIKVSTARDVAAELQQLEPLLRQGYKISYFSTRLADDQSHQLSVRVTDEAREAEASGSFVAIGQPLAVAVSGLEPGQAITRAVTLNTTVQTPAPALKEVKYFLDNDLLATQSEAPYAYTWSDPGASPGQYELTVTARDSADNTGQTVLPFTVARPLSVTLPVTPSSFELGRAISIPLTIASETELVTIEYFFDGERRESPASLMAGLTLDGSALQAGQHTLTVRVANTLGQTAQASQTYRFEPPGESIWARRVRSLIESVLVIAAAMTAIILTLIVALILLRWIAKSHQKFSRQIHQLQIANAGNIRSHYQLQIEEALGRLTYQFNLHGSPLPQFAIEGASAETNYQPVEPSGPYRPPAGAAPGRSPAVTLPQPEREPAPAQTQGRPGRPGVGQAFNQAQAASSSATGCLSSIGGIFKTLGQLLPGSLGRSMRSVGQQFSMSGGAIRRTTQAPQRVMSTSKRLKGQVGQFVPQTGGPSSGAGRHSAAPASSRPEPAPAPVAPTLSRPQPVTYRPTATANGSSAGTGLWAETPAVEPGQSLTLELIIDPVDPYQKQVCPFIINSRIAEKPDRTLLSETGQAEFPGISWVWHWLPIVTISIVTILLIGWVLYLAYWRLAAIELFSLFG